ncbi:MAG: hypothetical protein ACP5RP_04295 [Candidatus Micrarchaeia archaeon]
MSKRLRKARYSSHKPGCKAAGDPKKASMIIESTIGRIGISVSYPAMARGITMNTAIVINYFGRLENSFVFSIIYGLGRTCQK